MGLLLLKKEVSWSIFRQGFSIPIEKHEVFFGQVAQVTTPGDKANINLIIDNQSFSVVINNLKFSRKKYPDHSPIVQIRYDSNNDLKQYLKQKFEMSYEVFIEKRNEISIKGRRYVTIPKKLKEYFVLYTTNFQNTLLMDCITTSELIDIDDFIVEEEVKEQEVEHLFNKNDKSARIELVKKLTKIRRLNQQIGNNLKELYDNKCQICGYTSYDNYNCYICETHHIKSFVDSLNNDSDNILIICPNHHSVIHKTSPKFVRSKLLFKYPNGLEEKILINYHL